MRAMAFMFVLAVLYGGVASAQGSRDDWKLLRSSVDLEACLTHSLADATLTSGERAQIYRLIDDKTIHDSFTDEQREEERRTVMGARVGSIVLAEDGSRQVLVQGPALFCGASGNCSLWIFTRRRGKLQLVLAAGASVLIVRKESNHGFHDLVTGWHMSAEEEALAVYRWNGTEYKQVDCYGARVDPSNSGKPPVITDCPKGPQ